MVRGSSVANDREAEPRGHQKSNNTLPPSDHTTSKAFDFCLLSFVLVVQPVLGNRYTRSFLASRRSVVVIWASVLHEYKPGGGGSITPGFVLMSVLTAPVGA